MQRGSRDVQKMLLKIMRQSKRIHPTGDFEHHQQGYIFSKETIKG
jgi:HKD family nuclease